MTCKEGCLSIFSFCVILAMCVVCGLFRLHGGHKKIANLLMGLSRSGFWAKDVSEPLAVKLTTLSCTKMTCNWSKTYCWCLANMPFSILQSLKCGSSLTASVDLVFIMRLFIYYEHSKVFVKYYVHYIANNFEVSVKTLHC